uniref:T9SS type A sorting domain-containing protein n=1 Tax=candidate division WOR-3 bacterium TaxID=2052148 RepID=A0A7C4U6Q0_UNCW3
MIFFLLSLLNIISDTEDSLVFLYSPDYSIFYERDSLRIELDDGDVWTKTGEPLLPYTLKKIFVSSGGATLQYKVLKKEIIQGKPIMNKNTIFEDNIFDYKPVFLEPAELEIFGNSVKTGEIKIFPFSFDGDNIEIRKEILFKIYFKGKWFKPNYKLFADYMNKPKGSVYFKRGKMENDNGIWIKLKIVDNGIYKIDRKFLEDNGINPDIIAPENIEIRTGYKSVFRFKNSFYDSLDTLPAKIPAIYHLKNENGRFDEDEYILFYGTSLEGYERNFFYKINDYAPIPGSDTLAHYYYNPYTDTNVYWIKTNGERLEMEETNITEGVEVSDFLKVLHFEKDKENPSRSGLTWIWGSIIVPSDFNYWSYNFNIQDAIDSFCIVKFGIYCGISTTWHYARVILNNDAVYDTFYTPRFFYNERMLLVDTFFTLSKGSNNIRFEILNSKATIYIDYFEISYWKRISNANNEIIQFTDSLNRIFSLNRKYVLGIDDFMKPVQIKKIGNYYGYNGKKIFVSDTFYYPIEAKISEIFSLWNKGADWLCITSNLLKDEATKLANYRRKNLNGFENPITMVVTTDEIYDNFSYGVKDPGAIKRFLLHSSTSWSPSPSFVLLFGKGTYDYRNLKSITPSNNIVPIHTIGSMIDVSSILLNNPTVDVWFVDFDGNTRPDIPIGRLTVTNKLEANEIVEKIIGFESSNGYWRNRVIILADDEFAGGSANELFHTADCEEIYRMLPKWMEGRKVYMVMFPMEGGIKPSATNKFIEEFNEGAIFGYYFGHGNIYQLAHEKVLLIEDIPRFKNWRKTPMFYFATCNAGFFERPEERSIADYINIYPDGGTIVSIAATRATYPSSNKALAKNIVNNFFYKRTFGEVWTRAMNIYGDTTYTFFGDPATSLFKDTFSIPLTIPDTISGGNEYFLGFVDSFPEYYITINEPETSITYTTSTGSTVNFTLEGSRLFNAFFKNTDSISFILPFDTKEGNGNFRLQIYSENGESHIYKNPLLMKGLPSESIPPLIKLFSGNRELNDFDYVDKNSELRIVINDESGIDIRRKENIVLFINNYSNPVYLGDRFKYYTGTFKSWEVTFNLNTESDTLFVEIYCVDNCGNIGKKKIHLIQRSEEEIWGIYNYPNPASSKTYFTFYTLRDADVIISVYSVSGKKIWEKKERCHSGFNRIEWELVDDYGRNLGNGVYYYSIKIGKKKIIKKMSIIK